MRDYVVLGDYILEEKAEQDEEEVEYKEEDEMDSKKEENEVDDENKEKHEEDADPFYCS